jgi:hypothetical protein
MILLNFAHPLTPEQLAQIEALTGQAAARVIAAPAQFDHQRPFEPQLAALMAQLPLTAEEWQTASILVNPPALNFITALLLAELHGRMGYFPPVVRLLAVVALIPLEQAREWMLLSGIDGARDGKLAKDNKH